MTTWNRARYWSLPRLEIPQIRRRLILQGWHQVAICTEEIVFFADDDVTVVLGAVVFEPDDVTVAAIALVHGPRTRQRMVDRRYVVVQDVGVGFVEINTLQDDRFIVVVQRYAARFVGTGPLEIARLDLKRVEAAVAVGVEPFPDRVARKGWLDLGGPLASIGIDAARQERMEVDVSDVRQDDEFDRPGDRHHPRHAIGAAGDQIVSALSAGRLVCEARLQHGLIFARQRRLLSKARSLGDIPLEADPRRPHPLTRPVGIPGFVERHGTRA